MKKLFVTAFAIAGFYSCGDGLEYKYQDRELTVACHQIDGNLMKEALYSFEEDISAFYNNDNYVPNTPIYYRFGYANFIFTGATGEAKFEQMVSPHSLGILKELKKQEGLFIENQKGSNLNYNHEFVKCLIEKIENKEIKDKINTLLSVNFFSPKTMAEFYRVNNLDVETDKNFAMFIALDTYYQHLIDLEKSNEKSNG